ncbi:spore coat associated protein CotJA [Clostridium celatum]|uniref:Spore coat associated protein JA (CotJA) n=1 Tax=Clostridium celatum DSM 1785 TaxID=545697 RepID=L1Q6D6_9CLOT|nr:spore coat associated protein CotJA [Clostridium celatum]EKY23280.1 hypothetical protein HMPREF0216_02950 [Clostridium celatum DSM 1785]MCE9655493.1 spore coat associated protein CotJA [Clostridium celatum]MDU6295743.1 spore coat associated protein CotJA [Clostridium celatum]MDY3361527.1 spore coat associated protein CotJA [Clostridium celatum]
MYYERNNDCIDCSDCINDTSDVNCNVACANHKKNCYESFKVFSPNIYAKANIVLQPYQNLFDVNSAFDAGTIFKDLYNPYCDIKYSKEAKI